MPDYQLFGDTFRSEIAFPELAPSRGGSARWVLTRAVTSPPHCTLQHLGSEEVEPGVRVTLSRAPELYRLAFDDTGTFDLSPDGRHIRWMPPASPNMDAVRKDVLGRVASLALHLAGIPVLHGSAVGVDEQAIAFLAPKFHGKSTTAAAVVDRGGRLLADDLVAVRVDAGPLLLPGIPLVQLWEDSATHVARRDASARGDGTSVKVQRGWDDARLVADTAVPFGATYLLAPFTGDAARPVRRERLGTVAATLALVGQAKIGALLGPAWRPTLLDQCARIAAQVPVYRLEIPRDYARLDELADALIGWHAPASMVPA